MSINNIGYIKRKLRKYTSDNHLIDELAQVISIKLFERSYKYQNVNQLKKMINLLVKSTYIDYYRLKKIKHYELDSQHTAPEPDYINLEFLFTNIDKLPEKQKDVIILRYYFGFKYSKIAELFGCPKNTALSYFHKAKKTLRELLTKNQLYHT